MATSYAQQITPSSGSRVVTGSNIRNITEPGATSIDIGGSLTTKGVDLTGSTVKEGGSITIGEPGLGSAFADTVRQLGQSFSSAISSNAPKDTTPPYAAGVEPPLLNDPPAASADDPEWLAKAKQYLKEYWWVGVAVVAGWWFLRKR